MANWIMQLFSVAFVRALLFPRLPESIFAFAGIVFIRERHSRQNFLGESRYARLLGVKETKEYIPTFRSCCSITKVPLQNNCYSLLRQIKGLKQLLWPGYALLQNRRGLLFCYLQILWGTFLPKSISLLFWWSILQLKLGWNTSFEKKSCEYDVSCDIWAEYFSSELGWFQCLRTSFQKV